LRYPQGKADVPAGEGCFMLRRSIYWAEAMGFGVLIFASVLT
jgi:hypothetical protein